jgi:hypothetical protein
MHFLNFYFARVSRVFSRVFAVSPNVDGPPMTERRGGAAMGRRRPPRGSLERQPGAMHPRDGRRAATRARRPSRSARAACDADAA